MANRNMFKSAGTATKLRKQPKPANTVNKSGGRAYKMESEAALAQLVVTSCFNNTYYATAGEQIKDVKRLADECSTEFVAKAAVYAHETARMRDTPAFLLALLTSRGDEGIRYFETIFPRVVTNVKMLMNVVQIIRSGEIGRKSFGSGPKRVIRNWLASKDAWWLFNGSAGGNPSFADIVKMIHPKPENDQKKAFYAYMIGRPHNINDLPQNVANLEMFKVAKSKGIPFEVPDLPFELIASLPLDKNDWNQVAKNLKWKGLQKNLNTLQRKGVYDDPAMVSLVAKKLADPEAIRKASVFPYNLLTAFKFTEGVPNEIRNALQSAMEVATENVPEFNTSVAVLIDVSGSMTSPVTGNRTGATTKTTCVELAALMAATVLRRNKNAMVLPFDDTTHTVNNINAFDSVMTNAQRLAKYGGGGTDCSAPIRTLNNLVGSAENKPKLLIMVSDNESWYMNGRAWGWGHRSATTLAQEWAKYKRAVPDAKLVCLDINPNTTVQVQDDKSVLNIGGWSDSAWVVIEAFAKGFPANFADAVRNVQLG